MSDSDVLSERFLVRDSCFFFFSLCSAWMIGVSLRFMMMQSFEFYVLNHLDLFFDWCVLFFLGVLLFVYSVRSVLKKMFRGVRLF